MVFPLIAAGIAAAGSLAAGAMSNKAAKKSAKLNQIHERQMRQKEYEQQKEFAQSGIQWKVKDAAKAGVHPLYALGANTNSYAPQSVGSTPTPSGDFGYLADAGQHLGRGIAATTSNQNNTDAFTRAVQTVQLEGLGLDNDIKRAELASKVATTNQAGMPPGIPGVSTRWLLEGQPGGEIDYSRKQSPAEPGAPFQTAGAAPDVMFTRTNTGGYAPVMPENVQEAYENDMVGRWQWMLRNRLIPAYGQYPNIPHEKGVEGLAYDVYNGQWVVKNLRDSGMGHTAYSRGQWR